MLNVIIILRIKNEAVVTTKVHFFFNATQEKLFAVLAMWGKQCLKFM